MKTMNYKVLSDILVNLGYGDEFTTQYIVTVFKMLNCSKFKIPKRSMQYVI